MEAFILTRPAESYAAEIVSYRNEFLASGDSMGGCGDLRTLADPLQLPLDHRNIWTAVTETYRCAGIGFRHPFHTLCRIQEDVKAIKVPLNLNSAEALIAQFFRSPLGHPARTRCTLSVTVLRQ